MGSARNLQNSRGRIGSPKEEEHRSELRVGYLASRNRDSVHQGFSVDRETTRRFTLPFKARDSDREHNQALSDPNRHCCSAAVHAQLQQHALHMRPSRGVTHTKPSRHPLS